MGAFGAMAKSVNAMRKRADGKMMKTPEARLTKRKLNRAAKDTNSAAKRGLSLMGD